MISIQENEYYKNYIIILLLIIILLTYIMYKNNKDNYMTINNDVLPKIKNDLIDFIDKLYMTMSKNDLYYKNIKLIKNKLYDTLFYENYKKVKNNDDTSYNIDKGKIIVLCLRDINGHYYDYNTIMYVAIHEIAHSGTIEYGHEVEFQNVFQFLLEKAIKFNYYHYENYNINPINYCGISLNTNILN